MLKTIKNFKKNNSLLYELILGLLTAFLFSAFIYLEEFGFTIKILNTIFSISALALLLYIPSRGVLVAGFTIGLLWFYWVGYSFEYQGVGYMTPIITFAFGIIYMLFFGILALTKKVYIRALLLFSLSFFEPFDWNWLQIELIFTDSYIGIYKYQLASVLLALSFVSYIKKPYKYASLILLLIAINFNPPIQKLAPLKIKLIHTDIKQDKKWLRESLKPTILFIYKEIQTAIDEDYDLIVFPESVFPLYMNKNPKLINQLLILSKEISIVAGSLFRENSKNYNVTYLFEDGTYTKAKKLVLVPFGEYIPLPKFAQKFINDTFFSGASDFLTATSPTDFTIKGVKFRNAICYEATCQEIYEGEVDFVIATSNNAWFSPSIEPTLQKLLMRYYARKNGVTIYHSANYEGTGVIR
ncbi:apolipoprotein N-acyltransferase [Sulfurimonas sp.]|uniref:apolipoprotein N-acyltransferase n=1 Tax=Sulfurimonas sp. TaxID=2022749 RepID=UPI002B45E320|nr:apolipoprotein N-acyltransferase [Sulfurimonas sp.]